MMTKTKYIGFAYLDAVGPRCVECGTLCRVEYCCDEPIQFGRPCASCNGLGEFVWCDNDKCHSGQMADVDRNQEQAEAWFQAVKKHRRRT